MIDAEVTFDWGSSTADTRANEMIQTVAKHIRNSIFEFVINGFEINTLAISFYFVHAPVIKIVFDLFVFTKF